MTRPTNPKEQRTMTCTICARATHGSWPRDHKGTHCRDCHRSWASKSAAHALCCHRTFTSNTAADAHRVKGVCTDPATLEGFELITRADGNEYWMPTSAPDERENSDETAGVGQ